MKVFVTFIGCQNRIPEMEELANGVLNLKDPIDSRPSVLDVNCPGTVPAITRKYSRDVENEKEAKELHELIGIVFAPLCRRDDSDFIFGFFFWTADEQGTKVFYPVL